MYKEPVRNVRLDARHRRASPGISFPDVPDGSGPVDFGPMTKKSLIFDCRNDVNITVGYILGLKDGGRAIVKSYVPIATFICTSTNIVSFSGIEVAEHEVGQLFFGLIF